MTVRFDSVDFEWSHGRKPRGNGVWGFGFGCRVPTTSEAWFTPVAVTFTEAKRQAKAEAKRRGFTGTVFVLS